MTLKDHCEAYYKEQGVDMPSDPKAYQSMFRVYLDTLPPLPVEKRVAGQRIKWITFSDLRGIIEYTGVVVPLPNDHPLKEEFDRTHELIYVMPDVDKFPWLQAYPFAYWDFAVEGWTGYTSPLYED